MCYFTKNFTCDKVFLEGDCMQVEELFEGTNIEDEFTEFKGIIEEGRADSGKLKEIGWLKTLAGFANTEGGSLFVGVENSSHKILALDHDTADKITLMIHRQIKNRFEGQFSYKINAISVPNTSPVRYVLKIVVQKAKSLPVTLHEEGLLGIYVRNFGNTVLATPEQIRDMILLSDSVPFDQSFTSELFDFSDFSVLKKLYEKENTKELTEKALISVGFMNAEKHLSRGALLFKDKCMDNLTKITATQWPDTDKGSSVILASKEFTGNLLDGIIFAIDFIQNHSVNGFVKEKFGQSDYYSYPLRSITEGIVNAVAHRNYFINGSQIEINLFKDRLEITSPGALLGVRLLKKEKNISSIIPRRRNEVICSVLEMCRYMESKGSGFDKIEQDYSDKGEGFEPFISADSSSFTLTLPNLTFKNGILDENSIPTIYTGAILTGKNDEKILAFCYGKKRTAKEIADYLGVKPSSYFRKEVLLPLVEGSLLTTDNVERNATFTANKENVFIE